MAVVSKEEMLQIVRDLIGDRTDDDAIRIMENAKDTIEEFARMDGGDWKEKYEQNDAEWRRRYMERFNSSDEPKNDEREVETVDESERTETIEGDDEKVEETLDDILS